MKLIHKTEKKHKQTIRLYRAHADKEEGQTKTMLYWLIIFFNDDNPDNEAEVISIDYLRPPSPTPSRKPPAVGSNRKRMGQEPASSKNGNVFLAHRFVSFSADSHWTGFYDTCHVFGRHRAPLDGWMDGRTNGTSGQATSRGSFGWSEDVVLRNHHTLQHVINSCFVSFDFFKKKI